jgi:hypothetical protein
MGDSDSNIDLLFRNGLSNYEALPPADVWDQIRPAIVIPKRSFAGLKAAASVALLVGSGILTVFLVRNNTPVDKNAAIALNVPEQERQILNLENPVLSRSVLSPAVAKTDINTEIIENAEPVVTPVPYFFLPEPGLYTSFIRSSPAGANGRREIPLSIQQAYNPSYSDMASEADVRVRENEPAKENNWSISAMVTPAYYSQLDISGSNSESKLISSEAGAFSYSGGFALAYNLNKRFTVQTGINYSSIGQRIEGIESYSGFARYVTSKGVSIFGVRTTSGTIREYNSDIFLADNNSSVRVLTYYTPEVFDPEKNELTRISSSLTQNFNYVEVPVVLKYKVIDRDVDFKVIGGVSYNILVSNSAYASSGSTRYIIGKTEGLNPVTVSSSLGMGMEYNFSRSLSLNIEPTFRYYITSPGGLTGSSIHPYSFGILSGISYKF